MGRDGTGRDGSYGIDDNKDKGLLLGVPDTDDVK